MNGFLLPDDQGSLVVQMYQPRVKRTEFISNNLYVKEYPEGTTEEELEAIFGKYGPIISIKIPVDPLTSIPKKFGYVCFKSQEDA